MKFIEILNEIKEILSNFGGAELAFGKPTKIGDTTIITVAKTTMGFGGGGGSAPVTPKAKKADDKTSDSITPDVNEEKEIPQTNVSEGGGGGGGIKTSPVGIYVIREDKVKFYPVIGIKEIIALISLIFLLLIKLKKKKK